MEVIRSDVMGMCFGVKDALALIGGLERPEQITIHGELVHNAVVLRGLDARGFQRTSEWDRSSVPETSDVLITAHGISDRERARLEQAGKRLIDTTCPLVLRVHKAAQELAAQGFHVLVIGRNGHVEVRGIVEDLTSCTVLERAEEVVAYPFPRLGIVCQTTTPPGTVEAILDAVRRRNPEAEIRFVDTVCLPTKDRQQSLERLLQRVEAMVVVGGRNSNNTRELVALCQKHGVPACHVEGPEDLDPAWFAGRGAVGLTAGTSTLDETIDAVYQKLIRMT